MCSKDLSLSEKVAQLKVAIQDVVAEEEKLQSDMYLYHWLRDEFYSSAKFKANKYDVKKTGKAIRKNLKWREEIGLEELAKKDLDPALESRFIFLLTKGKGGIPVAFFSGDTDFVGILDDVGKKGLLRHAAQVLAKQENLVHVFDQTWKGSLEDLPAERSIGCCTICDMDGYCINQILSMKVLKYWLEYAKMVINYFPSASQRYMLVNTTQLLSFPLDMVYPIVADHVDVDIHEKNEEDVTVVSHVLKPNQLRKLQMKAKGMLGIK